MLTITTTGILTNHIELKTNETTGKPYALLRIASERHYRDRNDSKLTDFITAKVRGGLAEKCAKHCVKGCRLAVTGDFETIVFPDEPDRQPGFIIKARDVEFLFRRRHKKKRAENPTEGIA